jgi:hypothetical protein
LFTVNYTTLTRSRVGPLGGRKSTKLAGNATGLRRFKVDPTRDDLNALVVAPAAYLDPESELGLTLKNQASPQVVESLEYLLSFGPDLRQLIGSSIMEQFFRQIDWGCSGLNDSIYPRRLMEYVLCLAKHGLQWDGENLRYLRSALRRLEQHDKWKMLLALGEAKALTPKVFKALISKPPLREVVDAHPDKKKVINEAAGIRPIDSMIVQLVREWIASPSEIATKIGISQAAVSRRADRLIKDGRLAKKAGGKYKLGPNWWSTQD